jgi:glycosyltransferase involved in cell wall biosynthesis
MGASSTESASILCVGKDWFLTTPGGLERYVHELTHQLASRGDSVELCGVGLPEQHSSLITFTNLASSDRPLWSRLWSVHTNFSRRKVAKPDAINLHFALYSLPLLNDLPRGVPVTFTFHGPWALESQLGGANPLNVRLKQWIEQCVYQRCDRFIVLSEAFGQVLHQNFQISWDKIHIVPGGVDTERFQPNLSQQKAREQMGWAENRFILFTPRRLVERMGIDNLLVALANLKSRYPEVWLAIAGKGPLRKSLERQARDLGLEAHVKFLGYLPDEQLPIVYQAADLTVVPSVALEGFGLILLESLASGTPVLCTPVGGMPEVLANFSPELVTPSTEASSITTHLEAILSRQLLLPSRTACRSYAESNFDWGIISNKVRQILLT